MNRKKQLLYRISGWGFEKNVKRDERRAIIEQLGTGEEKADFDPRTIKGRTLDATKLNRWMRMEKAIEDPLSQTDGEVLAPGKALSTPISCIVNNLS